MIRPARLKYPAKVESARSSAAPAPRRMAATNARRAATPRSISPSGSPASSPCSRIVSAIRSKCVRPTVHETIRPAAGRRLATTAASIPPVLWP